MKPLVCPVKDILPSHPALYRGIKIVWQLKPSYSFGKTCTCISWRLQQSRNNTCFEGSDQLGFLIKCVSSSCRGRSPFRNSRFQSACRTSKVYTEMSSDSVSCSLFVARVHARMSSFEGVWCPFSSLDTLDRAHDNK